MTQSIAATKANWKGAAAAAARRALRSPRTPRAVISAAKIERPAMPVTSMCARNWRTIASPGMLPETAKAKINAVGAFTTACAAPSSAASAASFAMTTVEPAIGSTPSTIASRRPNDSASQTKTAIRPMATAE